MVYPVELFQKQKQNKGKQKVKYFISRPSVVYFRKKKNNPRKMVGDSRIVSNKND